MRSLIVSLLFGLVVSSACSSQKFSATVGEKKLALPESKSSEDAIGTQEEDKISPSQGDVPQATPIVTQKPKTETTGNTETPSVDTKPTTMETFSECGLYANTNIFADLYLTSEPRFYEVGQKPLAAQAYGSPLRTFCMSNLNVPLRNFAEGFPGFPDLKAWFILDIHFKLDAPSEGDYTIWMDSDDGSIVTINGEQIINVDGLRNGNLHVYEQRVVKLKAKDNTVRVQYMQGPGPDLALQLKWIKPGTSEAEFIPTSFIKKAR